VARSVAFFIAACRHGGIGVAKAPRQTRVVVELADLRGHPARAIARQHKVAVETWLTDALTAARVASPRDHAREVMLLMEGAMVLMLIHGDHSYAKAAARAAKTLVQKA